MPRVTRIGNGYKYICECGTPIVLMWPDSEKPPGRLVKCFECIKKTSSEEEES